MDKAVENADDLAHFLAGSIGYWDDVLRDVARWIFYAPLQHLEALVEAGVADKVGDHYRVRRHVHQWKVTGGPYTGSGRCENAKVELWCSCGNLRYAPNRLPLEVPND